VAAAWYSDRRKQRSPFILFFMCLIAIGFIIVIASTGRGVPGVVYFGVFIAVIGESSIKLPNLACSQDLIGPSQEFTLPSRVTSPG
jgi:hypothetical protein